MLSGVPFAGAAAAEPPVRQIIEEIVVTAPYPVHLIMEEIVVVAPKPVDLLKDEDRPDSESFDAIAWHPELSLTL
jgi:hypothetical protein